MSLKPIEPGCLALYHAGPSAAIRYYPPRVVKVISGPADMGVGVCLNCHKSDGDCIVDGLPNGYNSVCSCVLTRIVGTTLMLKSLKLTRRTKNAYQYRDTSGGRFRREQ